MSGVLHSAQEVGTIVRHQHVEKYDPEKPIPAGWEEFMDKNGMMKIRKRRYWIVIGNADDKIVEVAIYTNDNTGLRKKPKRRHHEYLGLCPYQSNGQPYENPVPKHEVLSIGSMMDAHKHELQRVTMVVNFKEEHTRSIDQDDLVIIGKLDEASNRVLLRRTHR